MWVYLRSLLSVALGNRIGQQCRLGTRDGRLVVFVDIARVLHFLPEQHRLVGAEHIRQLSTTIRDRTLRQHFSIKHVLVVNVLTARCVDIDDVAARLLMLCPVQLLQQNVQLLQDIRRAACRRVLPDCPGLLDDDSYSRFR